MSLPALPAVGTVTAVVLRATMTARFRALGLIEGLGEVIAHQDDDEATQEVWLPARAGQSASSYPSFFLVEAAITRSKWNCLLQPRGGRKRVQR